MCPRLAPAAVLRAVGLAAATLLAAPAESRGEEPVDLELLLAVDTSLSVSQPEFRLQMNGLAQAFRHPAVLGAIRAAGDRGIAVSLLQWSDRQQQVSSIDWMLVRDATSAEAFAARIETTARAFAGAGTSISGAILAGVQTFDRNRFHAPRRVMDISGDGIDNRGPSPYSVRPRAAAAGVTINGLTILNEDPFLDRYYERSVIIGAGAFVLAAADYDDFARAIVAKLVREISPGPVAGTAPAAPDG